MNAPPGKHDIGFSGIAWTTVVSALAVAALVGVYFGCYVGNDWNNIRLAPTLMWLHGANPYPSPGEAPITTWIYGPVPLMIYAPVALASDAFGALAIAFGVNLLLAAAPLALVVGLISRTDDWQIRLRALLLALAAWPACNLIYEQADNTAVLFGLLALGLFSGTGLPGRRGLWLAAFAGALALWSKPTELAPVLGQIALVALRGGKSAALRHTLRLAVAGGTCGIALVAAFGADGLIYNMFVVPSRIPWDGDVLKKALLGMIPAYILAYVLIPAAIWLSRAKRFLAEPGPAQAAGWFFILSLPFNVAGFAITGGSANALHGCAYMLPWLALSIARARPRMPYPFLMTALIGFQLIQVPSVFKEASPALARDSLRQGERLAGACRGRIYFPWNPLIAFYSEKKFHHVDDGILTRALTGEVLDRRILAAGLPENPNWIAYRGGAQGRHIKDLFPHAKAYYAFNGWTLVSIDGLLPSAFSPIHAPAPTAQTQP